MVPGDESEIIQHLFECLIFGYKGPQFHFYLNLSLCDLIEILAEVVKQFLEVVIDFDRHWHELRTDSAILVLQVI